MADSGLLYPTGCREPMAGQLFERSPAVAEVFPGADVFPKVPLARPPDALIYRLTRAIPPPKIDVVEQKPNRIVEILELGYEAYRRSRCLPAHVREAAQMLLRCRTSALGGHVEACPDGHIARIHYNSCGHRFCPRCGYRKRQKWIAQQREKLLPVRHFHVTFTIPQEFNELWWLNFKKMAEFLFHSAAQATQELLADAERVGVQVGIVAALHTWDDRLLRHPHLHCLVTGGGLAPEDAWKDSWKSSEKPFLVHVFPLMQRFRKLFCRRLERKIKQGILKLPKGCGRQQMLNLIHKVNRSAWQVYIAKPPEDGGPTTEEILEYQARAVAGGPLLDVRIEGIERKVSAWQEGIQASQEPQLRYVSESPLSGSRVQEVSQHEVSFRWGRYDKETGRRVRDQTETLPIEAFLRRLFWHVPPPDFRTIRHYGLYTSAKKAEFQQCRAILPTSPPAGAERIGTFVQGKNEEGRIPLEEYMQQRQHCPVCGKPLEITRVIPSSVTGKLSPRDKALARKLSGTQRRRRGG
jgi:predicted nucleic acid-binding Zn ribbon protein